MLLLLCFVKEDACMNIHKIQKSPMLFRTIPLKKKKKNCHSCAFHLSPTSFVGWGEWKEHRTHLQVLEISERWLVGRWHQMEFHKVSGGQGRECCGKIRSHNTPFKNRGSRTSRSLSCPTCFCYRFHLLIFLVHDLFRRMTFRNCWELHEFSPKPKLLCNACIWIVCKL